MKKIDIKIDKAAITRISFEFEEEKLNVTATIGLFVGQQKISDFTIFTETWNDSNKFNFPLQHIPTVKEIATDLESIVLSKCMSSLKMLPEKTDGKTNP